MLKKTFLLLFTACLSFAVRAQSADDIYNKYLDFNLARLQGENNKVLTLGEELIPNADKLPEKARISFYFSAGKMYEDNNQPGKARSYYEKVALAVPDYYVVHRALGYMYLEDVKDAEEKLKIGPPVYGGQLTTNYNSAIRKALPQLEKAQACDPTPETLEIIKDLYKKLNDAKGEASLKSRLKELSKTCVDILNDR